MKDKVFSKGFFKYVAEDGKVSLCSYSGFEKFVTIPKTLGGYVVTRIGVGAFKNCIDVTSINLIE